LSDRFTRDEAFLIAVNIAKPPSVPRQILRTLHGRRTRPAGMIEGEENRSLTILKLHVLESLR
jgi:hypothetical protein